MRGIRKKQRATLRSHRELFISQRLKHVNPLRMTKSLFKTGVYVFSYSLGKASMLKRSSQGEQ